MLSVIIFIISVALASVSGWGACYTSSGFKPLSGMPNPQWCKVDPNYNVNLPSCSSLPACTGAVIQGYGINSGSYYTNCWINRYGQNICGGIPNVSSTVDETETTCTTRCTNKCEADSLSCLNKPNGVWNSDSCKCSICETPDSTWTEKSCAWDQNKGMFRNIVNQHNLINCKITTIVRDYYGITCDSTGGDSTITCLGSVDGVHVFLRGASGKVTSCEADGSCDNAIRKVAMGQCTNPNPPPSSSSGGPNSSSSDYSSSSGDNSSSSGDAFSSSGVNNDDLEWLKDSLGVIHGTLEDFTPFIAGTYDGVVNLNSVAHDINSNLRVSLDLQAETRDNTGQTATNTGNIDNKLTTTNSLLNDIKNKNWNPQINNEVNIAGDTNIINVSVGGDTNIITVEGGDTSKAPSEILAWLKGFFNDTTDDYNPNDTAGTGGEFAGLKDSLTNATEPDTIPNLTDSIPRAILGVKGAVSAYRDSLRHSAYGDSLSHWENQLLNNGVLTGSGSNSCPQFLTRTYQWDMGRKLGTWNIGGLKFICEPISGVGVTFWELARMVLRAVVAISCMVWLYKTVAGIGDNNED